MRSMLIFPFKAEDDNKKAFAFTLELARNSNANITALTSLDLSRKHLYDTGNQKNLIRERREEIYCHLLEMKGYYHGCFNQWNEFYGVKIHVRIYENDMNAAICSEIDDYKDPLVLIQQKYFSGTGLSEEILSNPNLSEASIFILPSDGDFEEPTPDQNGVLFNNKKKIAFHRLLNEIKIFDLPREYPDFKQYMNMPQAEQLN